MRRTRTRTRTRRPVLRKKATTMKKSVMSDLADAQASMESAHKTIKQIVDVYVLNKYYTGETVMLYSAEETLRQELLHRLKSLMRNLDKTDF